MDTTETVERIDADLSTPDVAIRILATAGEADQRYPVPGKQRFKDAGEGVIEADDLAHVAGALIADATLPLGHLASLRIGYLWADRGGNAGGFPCFGRLIKASKALLHYAEIDYIVMLSADHLRDAKATRWQVEALIGHQLGHVEMLTTEKGEDRYSVKGHDFEGFAFEFRRWGAYLPNMVVPAQSAASAVQMGMVWEAGEDDEGGYDPSVDLPAGVDAEAGPVEGGAPEADWAEASEIEEVDDAAGQEAYLRLMGFDRTADALFGGNEPDDEEDDGPSDLEGRLGDALVAVDHEAAVRAAFPRQFRDGSTTCVGCGLPIGRHAVDYCEATNLGAPDSPKRRSRKMPHDLGQIRGEATGAAAEESPVSGESSLLGDPAASVRREAVDVADSLMGQAFGGTFRRGNRVPDPSVVVPRSEGFPPTATENLPPSNGNGSHDKDDVAALIADPDKVMAKVAEVYDMKIAYVVPPGERIGTYQHPVSGEIYDTQTVESLYRRALAGRTVV